MSGFKKHQVVGGQTKSNGANDPYPTVNPQNHHQYVKGQHRRNETTNGPGNVQLQQVIIYTRFITITYAGDLVSGHPAEHVVGPQRHPTFFDFVVVHFFHHGRNLGDVTLVHNFTRELRRKIKGRYTGENGDGDQVRNELFNQVVHENVNLKLANELLEL